MEPVKTVWAREVRTTISLRPWMLALIVLGAALYGAVLAHCASLVAG